MKPIYPEIFTDDYTLAIVDNGDGTISILEGQTFQIQDVVVDTTGRNDLTFQVSPDKTYHLRFSLNGRPINNYTPSPNSFYLVDISDTNYNPSGADETDSQFDTKYDDMLIAKIEVDSDGVITITPLKNKMHLIADYTVNGANGTYTFELNFSRTPRGYIVSFGDYDDYVKTDYFVIPDNPLTYYNGIVHGVKPTRYIGTIYAVGWDHSNGRNGPISISVRWEA